MVLTTTRNASNLFFLKRKVILKIRLLIGQSPEQLNATSSQLRSSVFIFKPLFNKGFNYDDRHLKLCYYKK